MYTEALPMILMEHSIETIFDLTLLLAVMGWRKCLLIKNSSYHVLWNMGCHILYLRFGIL